MAELDGPLPDPPHVLRAPAAPGDFLGPASVGEYLSLLTAADQEHLASKGFEDCAVSAFAAAAGTQERLGSGGELGTALCAALGALPQMQTAMASELKAPAAASHLLAAYRAELDSLTVDRFPDMVRFALAYRIHCYFETSRLQKVEVHRSASAGPQVVFVLGGPGAGKGTQCTRISEAFGFHHLSAGDLLREERARPGSEYGELIESYIREGKLVPVDITVKLLEAAMKQRGWADGKFLIDGFPRSKENLEGWDRVIGDQATVKFALFFDLPEACMEERLLERGKTSGRSDDNIESIRKRFRTFQQESVPVAEHLASRDLLKRVSAEESVEEVWHNVQAIFGPTVVFVLGGPGSGKGTLCSRITQAFGYAHLSAGDLLREERQRPSSEYGELIESHIREGKLVPAEITVNLLLRRMRETGWEGGKYLVDGFPRSSSNLEAWEQAVQGRVFVKFGIYLECSMGAMEERLLRRGQTSGRSDDNIEVIRKRFMTFHSESMPIVEKLQAEGMLRKVDAEKSPDEVWKQVQPLFGPSVVFVLGGPGSGKGTVCARIAGTFNYHHLSVGDLLRDERNRPGSKYGELIEGCIRDGKLVPVEIVVKLLRNAMWAKGWERGKYLIDGFPRSAENMEGWTSVVGDQVNVQFALHLDATRETMEARILERGKTSGRSDDNAETLRKRFDTFQQESVPVLHAFEAQGRLRRVNSEKSVDEVWHSAKMLFAPTVIFVLGGPGAGKGTQCERIAGQFGFHHLSAGDLLRAERKRPGSEMGELIEGYIRDGKLVPVDITVQLLQKAMEERGWEGGRYLVDGFPRSADNMEGWQRILGDKVNVKFCLFFECSEATMERRLLDRGKSSGRSDDNAATIRKRFQTFSAETVPIVAHFQQQGRLRRVDSEQEVEDVWASVQEVMSFEMNPHMPNQALVFLKPHAHNPQAERFLQSYLVTHGIAVLDRGAVSASELAERGLFDAHYSQLAANASADPGALQVPPRGQEAFEQRFGVAWHDAVGSAAVLPATEAGARLQMTNQQLLEAWDAAGPLKLAPSLYVARLTSPAAPQAEAFVVNAFLCQQRDSFLKGGEGLLWLVVEFDPAVISWGKFRSDICGSTNPSKAPEESIRGQFYRHWEALGLDGMPSTMNNAVHASAGPLEALRERLLWTGAKLEQDPLGRSLLAAGVPPGTVELWMGNPGVDRWPDGLRSQGGPIFDCTEDTDTAVFRESAVKFVQRAGIPPAEFTLRTVPRVDVVREAEQRCSTPSLQGSQRPKAMTILHFNDVYNVAPREKEPVGGVARFVTRVRELKAESVARGEEEAVVLFSGDAFNPSMTSTTTFGKHMVPALNAIGIHTACYGNHDFDFGVDNLISMASSNNFPWLISNVTDKKTGRPLAEGLTTRMLDFHGRKIGLIGLVEKEWLVTLATIDPDDVEYEDFCPCARRLATQLKTQQGAEIVIALTHMRVPNDELLAHEIAEVDIILGGHDHHYDVKPVGPHGTYVLKSGTDFRDMTELRLLFTDDGTAKPFKVLQHTHVEIFSSITEDPEVSVFVEECESKVRDAMNKVVGETAVDLDCRFSSIRTMETNIGNFITDVMLKGMKADLAVLNSGTLRADAIIEAGPIRMRDLVNILPMLDELCLLQLTGEQILQVLENSVSQYPRLEGRFAQVSGVTFTFDAKGSPGSRVLRDTVKIGGAALEHQRCYKLCTKDYLRQGKDGYDVFRDAVCLADGEQAGILPSMVREHFKAIEALNGDAPEASTAMAGRALSRQASKRQATMDLSRIGEGPECTKRFAIAPQVEGRVVCLNPAT